MTQLERFRAFLAREEPDRPLRYAHYTPPMLDRMRDYLDGEDPDECFRPDDGAHVGLRPPEDYEPPDFTPWYDEGVDPDQIDDIGVWRRKGTFYHFTHRESPLRDAQSLEEIEDFPIETQDGWRENHMAEQVERFHAEGLYVMTGGGHIYEDSWQIRGYQQFLEDLMLRPEWAESILDRITRRNTNRAEAAARAGVDMLQTGDDIANQQAMMFNPDLWRRVLKSRWQRVYRAARRINPEIAIWYHSDGNITEVIDDLIEIGVTVLNPLQPECIDVEGVCRRYGDRLLFDGTIGTQSTFPWGDPEEMRRTVRRRREVFGSRLMLSPTHVLEPEVPPENVVAFYEAAGEPF
ncbi:MAG: uroporphyrinogen decarboxylase family protein [Planctomycetota bacterium]